MEIKLYESKKGWGAQEESTNLSRWGKTPEEAVGSLILSFQAVRRALDITIVESDIKTSASKPG